MHANVACVLSQAQKYEYYAAMSCGGCKNAIGRILSNTPGITSFEADIAAKKIVVTGTAERSIIEERLNKWASASNKEVRFVKELN